MAFKYTDAVFKLWAFDYMVDREVTDKRGNVVTDKNGNALMEKYNVKFRTYHKAVLNVIAERFNKGLGFAWPGYTRIAKDACCTRRQAIKVMNELRSLGLLVKRQVRPHGKYKPTNTYVFSDERIEFFTKLSRGEDITQEEDTKSELDETKSALPEDNAASNFTEEQKQACSRLAEKFLEHCPPRMFDAQAASWGELLLPVFVESTEEELRDMMDWALTKDKWWIDRLLNFFKKNGFQSPLHAFVGDMTDITMGYFTHKRKEEQRKFAIAKSVNTGQTAKAYNEERFDMKAHKKLLLEAEAEEKEARRQLEVEEQIETPSTR
jgi:hypothetical protein